MKNINSLLLLSFLLGVCIFQKIQAQPLNCGESRTLVSTYISDDYEISSDPCTPFVLSSPTRAFPIPCDDCITGAISIGFPFNFFGNVYNDAIIQSNGMLGFGAFTFTGYTPFPIPNASLPNNYISGIMADIDIRNGGTINYELVGTAPNRSFVVNYDNVATYGPGVGRASFQIVLNEDNSFQIIIEEYTANWNANTSGPLATSGVENLNGSYAVAIPGRNNSDWRGIVPSDQDCHTFTPVTCNFVRWLDGGVEIGTNPTITVSPSVTTTYTAEWSCGSNSVFFDETVVVAGGGVIPIDLGADSIICETSSILLDGSDPSYPVNVTYQWQRSIDGGTTYTDIAGATSATYMASETLPVPQTPFDVFYKLLVQIPASTCGYEGNIKITYEPLPITNLIIEADSICNTGEGTIRIVNPEIGTRYSYQLYENNAGVLGAPIGTAQSSTTGVPIILTTPTISTTTSYFVVAENTIPEESCLSTMDVVPQIIVHPLPTAEFDSDASFCEGDDVELTINMTGTQPFTLVYQRDADPAVTVSGIMSDTYSFFTNEAGTFTVNSVQDAFCENLSNPITATVTQNPNPSFTLGNDTTLCDSQAPLVLEGQNTVDFDNPSYKWFRDGGELIGETGSTLTTNVGSVGLVATTYEYILEVTNNEATNTTNCVTSDTILVTFTPNPSATITFSGSTFTNTGGVLQFCDSEGTKTLNGFSTDHTSFTNVTYEWTDLGTGTVVGTNPTLDVSSFGTSTDYQLLVTDGGTAPLCSNIATVTVQFIENPVAEISHDGTPVPVGGSLDFCFDDGTQTLDGVHPSHAGLGTVTYEWTDLTNSVALGNTPQIDISNPTNTFTSIDYQLIVRDESNTVFCERTATMTVNFYPNPEAEISFGGNIETGNTLQFCDSEGTQTLNGVSPDHTGFANITYEWTDLGTGTVVGTNPTLDVSNFGATTTYELKIGNGITPLCERTAQITIQFIENPIAEISHDGTAIPTGGSLDFCFDDGVQTLDGVHSSHAGLGTVTYEWTDLTNSVALGNTPQINISNPTNTVASIDYQLIVRDESNPTICQSTTTITVNFAANPEAEIQFGGGAAPTSLAFCDSEGAKTLEGALPSHSTFGSVSYIWTQVGVGVVGNSSSLSVSSSATYVLEVISNDNPNLCSRTDQVTVEFFPSPNTDITFEGAVVTELGFCTSEGTKVVSAPASPFYTYQWYVGTTANPLETALGTNQTQTVDNFAPQGGDTNTALYTVVVTDTRATCPAQSSVTVNFYAEPEIDATEIEVSASPITHCVTGTSNIVVTNAEQGVEYQLFREGIAVTGAIQTPTTDLATITFNGIPETTTLTTGESRFIYSVQATRIGDFGKRCTQMLEDTATVIVYPEPTANVSGTATVCADSPTDVIFTITGNFPAELTYEVTDTFGIVRVETEIIGAVGSASPQTFVINTNTNTYKPLSITDRYCSGTVDGSEAIITTVHPPEVNWVEFDTAFCIDEPVTFEVTGGISHEYYINGLPVSNSNPYTLAANSLEAGTYEIYAKGFATAGGCSANSDTVTFIVHPLPVVDLGVDRIKCVDDTTHLVATQDGSFIYDWKEIETDGDIVSVGNGNDSLYVNRQGTYFVIVTNLATGCSDSSNIVNVTNYDTLDVDLGEDVFVCNPSSLPYRLVGSDISHQLGTTYEWYRENDNTTIIGTDSIYDVTEEGVYRVTAIDPRGCEARDTIRVNFTADPDFQIIGHDDYACGRQDTLRIEATNLRNMIIDWQGNGIVSLSDSNRRAIVNVSGIYTVTVTDTSTTANCSVTKSVEVFVRPQIALSLPNTGTSDTTTLCQTDSLLLDAFDPTHDNDYEYRWTWLESNQVIATTSNVTLTYSTTESFTSQRFEVRVTDPDGGCFATDTVNVRFRRVSTAEITASDSIICLGESVTLQGKGGDNYSWTLLGQNTPFSRSQNIVVTPDSVGTYTYILNTRFGSSVECDNISDSVTVVVNRKAVANIEENDIRLCENEQLVINGFLPDNPAFTRYIWTHEENDLVLSTDSVLNISFDEIQPISYEPFHIVLTTYDSLTGCDSTDRVRVKFNRSSDISIDSTYAREICIGEEVTLNARGATSYYWRRIGELGDTTVLDSVAQITVRLDTVGFHRFIVTGGYENECQNTGDTAIFFVNPLPTIKAHVVDTISICAGDSIKLLPSGGVSYAWLNDPTAFDTITVSPRVPTDYIVFGTDSNGCQSTDTVHVYVTPTFELPELLQVCAGDTVMVGDTLNFADSAANLRASYFWRETGDITPFIKVTESGTYTVEVSIDDCFFTRTTEVQVKEKPVLELVSDTTLCFELGAEDRFERGQTHILRSNIVNRDSATTYLYVWTDSTGNFLGNRDSLEIEAGGNYRLRVIARYDTECETNDSTFVAELCAPRLFIPEAFTPNGDNLNDTFEVFGKHIKNFEMQIFSRWSEVIFSVRVDDIDDLEPQDFWDGTHKGKNVPTGAYVWIIRYTDPFSGSTKQITKTGSLMIVR